MAIRNYIGRVIKRTVPIRVNVAAPRYARLLAFLRDRKLQPWIHESLQD